MGWWATTSPRAVLRLAVPGLMILGQLGQLALAAGATAHVQHDFSELEDYDALDIGHAHALEPRQSSTGFWRCNECWNDSTLRHFFTGSAMSTSSTMTNPKCQTLCLASNYQFAGTRNGNECWCGNETTINKPATLGALTDCTVSGTACGGDSTTKCGSASRMYVCTWIPPQAAAATYWPRAEPLNTWNCGRCWSDSLATRTLGTGVVLVDYELNTLMSNEKCQTYCQSKHYAYAGTEAGNQCYCGSYLASGAQLVANSNCNTACYGNNYFGTGNPTETCGGTLTLSVCENHLGAEYPTVPSLGSWQEVGCVSAYSALTPQDVVLINDMLDLTLNSNPTPRRACINYCDGKGYVMAAVAFGNTCYCGNQINWPSSKTLPQPNCNMPCVTNSSEICGDTDRANVFQKTAQYVSQTNTWKYYDCVVGGSGGLTGNGVLGSPLNGPVMVYPNNNTQSRCYSWCQSQGYGIAGFYSGNVCQCGTALPTNTPSTTGCGIACAGDTSVDFQRCGGASTWSIWYNSTYVALGLQPTPPTSSTPINPISGFGAGVCYNQSILDQALRAKAFTSLNMTIQVCESWCYEMGYYYSGVSGGNTCSCDDNIAANHVATPSTDCSTACAGNSAQQCGGTNRISINAYTAFQAPTALANWTSIGCAPDNYGLYPALQGGVGTGLNVTVESCESYCQFLGYPIAGLEAGTACYCGKVIQPPYVNQIPSDGCWIPCAQNRSENCGGTNRISLYEKQLLYTPNQMVNNWTYYGCLAGGALNVPVQNPTVYVDVLGMSVQECEGYCAGIGAAIAAVQVSTCYCGNSFVPGRTTLVLSGCSTVCVGDVSSLVSQLLIGKFHLHPGRRHGPATVSTGY